MMHQTLRTLRVTEIGEFVRHDSCERRFRLGFNDAELVRQLPFAGRLFAPLDPVLQRVGEEREARWEQSLRAEGLHDLSRLDEQPTTDKRTTWSDFIVALRDLRPGMPAYVREVEVSADVGTFRIFGRIDFVLVQWQNSRPRLRLVECKASRKDRTYHRIQVAAYKVIMQRLLAGSPVHVAGTALAPEDIECVVARVDEGTNECQRILDLDPLNLDAETEDLEHLLSPEGLLAQSLERPLDDIPFQIEPKCDGCVFNVHCMPESARQRRLELAGIDATTAQILRIHGIQTLDHLAELNPQSEVGQSIRRTRGFTGNLDAMKVAAAARRQTLPGTEYATGEHEVTPLPNAPVSQLPPYEIDGRRSVRVYLAVDYDYAENRIGALTAHVTSSAGEIHTPFADENGKRAPDPTVCERVRSPAGSAKATIRPVQGTDVLARKESPWSADQDVDASAEAALIERFFRQLVDAIADAADGDEAPVHFYVWSRSEVTQLMEGCSRADTTLLQHLQELLGCRESMEQVMYSCLQDEVARRFALGWTGQGLVVAASLRWFGRRWHWKRNVNGEVISLDRVFRQDLFDFTNVLEVRHDGSWEPAPHDRSRRHVFEVRSRFHDSLPAPYWHAVWGTLPDPSDSNLAPNLREPIRRYLRAGQPALLDAYLVVRVHALRWIEERMRFKNVEISKPPLEIARLNAFSLQVHGAAQAALDFLRLDQHVKTTDWTAAHTVAPAERVLNGRTLPLRSVRSDGGGILTADLDLEPYALDASELEARTTFAAGSFVRLSPHSGDPERGQTVAQLHRGGSTCIIRRIDWDSGVIQLSVIPMHRTDRYRFLSRAFAEKGPVLEHATLDENPSDFVAARVDDRLVSDGSDAVVNWFDRTNPRVPAQPALDNALRQRIQACLRALVLPDGHPLAPDQQSAILEGLDTRVQLVQGPPGTGKTTTTAVAVLARIAARVPLDSRMFLSAHTHTAVDTLLKRIAQYEKVFRKTAEAAGITMPPVRLARIHSSTPEEPLGDGILNLAADNCGRDLAIHSMRGVLVVGGTTATLLKAAQKVRHSRPWNERPEGLRAYSLIVDEASMMVFPHFLALTTLVDPAGEILLAGDHRQLAPIVSHDWEHEDRPPSVLYQPYVSAYEAIWRLAEDSRVPAEAVKRSALSHTFRLPPAVRELISRVYDEDGITLTGPKPPRREPQAAVPASIWNAVWRADAEIVLIVHNERDSRESNELEAEVIHRVLAAAQDLPRDSVAVVTPHRAQRALLARKVGAANEAVSLIDTVERLQGGERPVVVVSGTASAPAVVASRVDFLLDLNRANVAFSRTKARLIVVCSEALLNHVPAEMESYRSAALWKSLRGLCTSELMRTELEGHQVRVLVPEHTETSAVSAYAWRD